MDYTIQVDLKKGGSRKTSYQRLIDILGLYDESYLGEPLSEGTQAQARYVALLLKSQFPEILKVTVRGEKEEEVAMFGLLNELL